MLRLFLLFLSPLCMSGAAGESLTLQDLQNTYKKSEPGTLICYYDGSSCNRETQVCSPQTRTCEEITLFEQNATDEEKLTICRDYIRNDTKIDPFIYDACIYIIGKMTAEGRVDCSLPSLPITRPVGEDFCPFIDPTTDEFCLCKRGQEFCTEKGCQPLFERGDISDEEKRERCLEVVKEKATSSEYDSCLYTLGSLGSLTDDIKKLIENNQHNTTSTLLDLEAKIAELKEKVERKSTCPESWLIPVVISISILFLVVVIVATIWCLKRKKRACFKGPKQVEVDEENPAGEGDDQNQEERRLTENAGDENLDRIDLRQPDPNNAQGDDDQTPADAIREDDEVNPGRVDQDTQNNNKKDAIIIVPE